MSDPHEWHVAQDSEGFFIEDEYGEEINPIWVVGLTAGWRCQSYAKAEEVLHYMVQLELDNQEPPDPPGWEGGFADNH